MARVAQTSVLTPLVGAADFEVEPMAALVEPCAPLLPRAFDRIENAELLPVVWNCGASKLDKLSENLWNAARRLAWASVLGSMNG